MLSLKTREDLTLGTLNNAPVAGSQRNRKPRVQRKVRDVVLKPCQRLIPMLRAMRTVLIRFCPLDTSYLEEEES